MGLKTEEDIKIGFTNINTQQLFHPEGLANTEKGASDFSPQL